MRPANHADWMQPPGNRWSFRHVREFMPSARIRASASPREWEGAPEPSLAGLDVNGTPLLNLLTLTFTDAICVLHRGRIVFEWLGPGVRVDDSHILMSVSKSITALLALALADRGALDLEAPVATYLPEARSSAFGDATVRHLADMTVSSAFVEDYTPGPDVAAYRRSTGWYPSVESGGPGLHEYLCSIRPAGRHGERFHYISPCTDTLGWVCERAAGVSYADALSDAIWKPIGASLDGDVTVDRFGAARAAGGICVGARDMALVGQILVEGGAGVISERLTEDLLTGGSPELWARGDFAESIPGGCYRSSWYQQRGLGSRVVQAIGIHGQLIHVDVGREVVVAKQSSWPTPTDDSGDLRATAAADAIARALAAR